MKNNELLQSICNTLKLGEEDLGALLALCDHDAGSEPDASPLQDCSNEQLRCALEGLILAERGPRSDGKPPDINNEPLSNNEVLKKLRIALNLQQEDMLLFFEEGGVIASKARRVARQILIEIEKPNTEIFPKQDKLDTRTQYGNFINAPLFGKLVPEGRTVFLAEANPQKPCPDQIEYYDQE